VNPILDQLKDIHPPGHIPFWPPAVGWWLTIILIALLAWVGYVLFKLIFKQRYIKAAHKKLDKIYEEYTQTNDSVSFVREVSKLLRRVSLTRFPRKHVASLTGKNWLSFLDKGLDTQPFSQGAGRILLDAPYRKTSQYDVRELYLLCRLKINSLEDHYKIARVEDQRARVAQHQQSMQQNNTVTSKNV
jgi:hypothetical protein